MALPKADWRVYTGTGLLIWAGALQLHMWSIQKRPEYKEKFETRWTSSLPPISSSLSSSVHRGYECTELRQ
ncbi:g7056 [Coccomyxa elongata]